MKGFFAFIMRGRGQAAGVTLFFSMLPFLSFISAVTVALVTLRKGWQESLIIIGVLALLGAGLVMVGVSPAIMVMLVAAIVPVWLMALVLRLTISISWTLQIGALFGVLVVLLVYGLVDDVVAWWEQLIMEFFNALQDQAKQDSPLAGANQLQLAAYFAQIATGVQVASLLLWSSINLLIARWGQSLLYNPGGFQKEFHGLRLGVPALMALAICVGGALVWPWLWNVVWVVGVPFVLAGVALVHGLASKQANARMWLILFYITLLLLMPYTLWIVMALALIDVLADFRRRAGVTNQ